MGQVVQGCGVERAMSYASAKEPLLHSRPIPTRYSIEWEWQAYNGATPIGPKRTFFKDALNDLAKQAEVMFHLESRRYSVLGGWFRVAPVSTGLSGTWIGDCYD